VDTANYKKEKGFNMINLLGRVKRKLQYALYRFMYRSSLKAYWYENDHNFGDILNPQFIHALSGKNVIRVDPKLYRYKNYIVIGSILDKANQYSTVWGSGFISKESTCYEKPFKICAVRGPLTRQKLLESGIDCPEIYGDPALLLPQIYTPKKQKKYTLGIIAHYIDKDNIWLKNMNDPNVLLLDIQCKNPLDFIEQVYSCEKIASSSLHGLIVADAYGIPSLWLEFSDKILGKGFKFLDYFLSVHRSDTQPFIVKNGTSTDELMDGFNDYEIDIDLSKLLDACPFKLPESLSQKNNQNNL
jgi:pyruvyltransferase